MMTDDARPDAPPLWDRLLRGYLTVSRVVILTAATLMFVLMIAVNAVNITMRALNLGDIQWAQEVSILAAMWVYFAAYALIAKEDGYIRIEFIADMFPFPVGRTLQMFARIATIVFHATVFVFTFWALKVVAMFETNVLQWPEFLFYVPLLVGAGDIVITEVIHLMRTLAGRVEQRQPAVTLVGTGS
jgi:TRAP-type C4-dicarboxylate transport system permease small subunit